MQRKIRLSQYIPNRYRGLEDLESEVYLDSIRTRQVRGAPRAINAPSSAVLYYLEPFVFIASTPIPLVYRSSEVQDEDVSRVQSSLAPGHLDKLSLSSVSLLLWIIHRDIVPPLTGVF